jgi:hypothetical protein
MAWAQAIGLTTGAVLLGLAAWRLTPGVVALSCFDEVDACIRPGFWSYVEFGAAWGLVAVLSIAALAFVGSRACPKRIDWIVVATPTALAVAAVYFVGLLP